MYRSRRTPYLYLICSTRLDSPRQKVYSTPGPTATQTRTRLMHSAKLPYYWSTLGTSGTSGHGKLDRARQCDAASP